MNTLITCKFWGVRGSYPTAQRGQIGIGGNTASVEISTPFARLLLDAGTGIITLGQTLLREKSLPYLLLLSHWHHDHTQGLPFFAPLFQSTTDLTIVASARDETDLENKLRAVMHPPHFPIPWHDTRAKKHLLAFPSSAILYLDSNGSLTNVPRRNSIRIRLFHSTAHPGGVTLYRIEFQGFAIVYATDVESDAAHAAEIAAFARGADLLIHDAQYEHAHYAGELPFPFSTRGFGHSTNEMAAQVAHAAQVKQLALFHHDPNYDDDTIARIETQTRALFPNVIVAREGMTLQFKPQTREAHHVLFSPLDAALV